MLNLEHLFDANPDFTYGTYPFSIGIRSGNLLAARSTVCPNSRFDELLPRAYTAKSIPKPKIILTKKAKVAANGGPDCLCITWIALPD